MIRYDSGKVKSLSPGLTYFSTLFKNAFLKGKFFMSKTISKQHEGQRGMTLIELIAGLAIMASVIVGALSLFNTTSISQKSTQISTEIHGLRSAMSKLYSGMGTFGTANMNTLLVTAGKVPSTLRVTPGTPPTITHGFGGNVVVTGATNFYHISLAGVPQDACVEILTGSGTWDAITYTTVPSAAGITAAALPANYLANAANPAVDPAAAATACDGGNKTLYFASR